MHSAEILGACLKLTLNFVSTQSKRVLIVVPPKQYFKGQWGIKLGAFVLLALTSTFGLAALPKAVAQELRRAGIPQSSVSVMVQEVGGRRSSLAFRAGAAVNPASLMKLVTTYAALELLTPAYRWRTEVYADGRLAGGVLEGDLALRGSGDPKLDFEGFWMMLRGLRGRGLREIRGDVVIDRSYFGPASSEPIDDDAFRPYNALPDALLVNYRALRFVFLPELERNSVHVFAEPALPGLELVNGLTIVERDCPEGRAFRALIEATFQAQPPRASFTGVYPASCGERDLHVALYPAQDYLAAMIGQLWSEMGGRWSGALREGSVPSTARLVHVHESQPLAEIVRDINKFSNNVMARQLYLTLGAEHGGAPADAGKAERAVREWLAAKRLRAPGLVMENGSGLSRSERISAATLSALLQAAWQSPVMPEFVASLPVAAIDGTMRKRLHGEDIAGRAHVKTGLLSDVRSIAGYVLDRKGRRHVAVMIVNHPNAHQAQPALDAMLSWVYESGARGPARSRSRPRAASLQQP
jgi:D-alanyl-D-alanine carboxypeptidase/D-alanyl-D-alanine-endopeptidase (penicillin-binding protein 4)